MQNACFYIKGIFSSGAANPTGVRRQTQKGESVQSMGGGCGVVVWDSGHGESLYTCGPLMGAEYSCCLSHQVWCAASRRGMHGRCQAASRVCIAVVAARSWVLAALGSSRRGAGRAAAFRRRSSCLALARAARDSRPSHKAGGGAGANPPRKNRPGRVLQPNASQRNA